MHNTIYNWSAYDMHELENLSDEKMQKQNDILQKE